MSEPVYVGMPPTDTRFTVPRTGTADPRDSWGDIRCGGICKDDYKRIQEQHTGNVHYKLQAAAMESLRAASKAVGFEIEVTGTWRSCAFQTACYKSDQNRFAPPDKTAHTRGLAIDVTTAYGPFRKRKIRKALEARGWHQARPDDEPWHYSFGIQV